MNLQNLKETLVNAYGSPLLYDGSNGNEEEQETKCSECQCNQNHSSLPFVDAKYEHKSVEFAQVPNGLQLENTVDYTCKNAGGGILEVTGQADACTMELEETVDYVSSTPLEEKSALVPLASIFSTHESTISPGNSQCMHNLQNVEQTMHYKQYFSDMCCGKNELQRTLQLSLSQSNEACGNAVFKQEGLGLPVTKHKDVETTLSLFSCDMSSEMHLRKNSLISSGSEKPLSASILESSTLPNTSTEVFSASLQWAKNVADYQCVEPCTKDINFSEVPLLISKEMVMVSKGPDAAVQLLGPNRDVATCSTPEEASRRVLETPSTKKDPITKNIGTTDMSSFSGVAQEADISVLCIEEESNAKEVNRAPAEHTSHTSSPKSTSVSQSCSSGSRDVLNMLSGHTAEDTFLVESPSFHADAKAFTSTPLPESKNMTFAVPLLEDSVSVEKLNIAEKDQIKGNALSGSAGTSKPLSKKVPAITSVTKVKKTEVLSFPKPNFRNVKAKVLTRPALMVKDCPTNISKSSPRSPQLSASNASSPVASPRAPSFILKTVRKKSVLDQDLKAEAVVAKLHKQPIIKQLLPSQLAHAPTHMKHALGKVPRAAALKQTQDEIERASSSNSTRSSGSAAALTCTSSSKATDNKDKVKTSGKPAAVNGVHMGPDTIQQNGLSDADYEKSQSQKEECSSADIFSSAEPFSARITAPSKNLHNQLLSSLKSTTSQLVPKARLHSSDQRRVSVGKNVVTIRVSSPPRVTQQPAATTATSSLKNDEVPAKCMRQNGIIGSQPSKVTLSRSKTQPLKAAQTIPGTKKSPIANQGILKSSGSSATVSKRLETKAVNGVDKGKPKTSPRGPVSQTPTAPADKQALELAQCKARCEEQKGVIQQLKSLLTCSNQKFEALTVVIQHVIGQREEALKKRKELSQELQNLRGELVSSSSTCDKLEKEKTDLLTAYEGILQKVKDEHIAELSDLEEKLKQFYTGECEKLQSIFIEEAEKYKNELQGKVDDLNTTHEAYRQVAEASHTEEIEHIKKEYENSLKELKATQELENKALEDSFKKKHAELEQKIEELRKENESLKEKLKAEDEHKKTSKEKATQKNPQVMYLEQELESLKAVLEIKNEKLHQQDKKLMQVEKLVETNTTLVERLNKCQQENEDLKARMANHIAISRQLSSEQELLQRSLEKESKANKRLSMENEELIWKLHNGDLCSPKKLSPSSPGIPFHPSRNSGSFSSPTVSPR